MIAALSIAFVVVLASLGVHEAGHLLAAQVLGLRWRPFVRFPLSVGIASEPSRIVAVAGPLFSLIAGIVAFEAGWFGFAAVNLFLGVSNLLPIPLFDGWRLLRRA